jgi:ornithine cyclodeaminase/alanine dehydrogenase-like protein (mu-crystallin family)
MRVITEAETRQLMSVAEAHAVIEEAYADYGREGNVTAEPSTALMVIPHEVPSICSTKGSFLTRRGLWGVRMGMQTGNFYSAVLDSASGRMLGLVEETWLARRRVGSTAAVAAKHLARRDSKIIALIGAGQLMEETYLCMPHAFPDASYRVASRTLEGAEKFAQRLGTPGRPPLTAVASAADAIDGADIVVSITLARAPMILPGMLKTGATVLSMGGSPEVDFRVLPEFNRLVVDEMDYALYRGDFACWVNAGLIKADALRKKVDANIGEVVLGSKKIRTADTDRILAVIQGMAVCDLAMAAYCIEKGAREGIGSVVTSLANSPGRTPPRRNGAAAHIAQELQKSKSRIKQGDDK